MQHPTPVFADPVPHFRFPLLGQFHDFGQQQLPHQAHVDQKRADGDQSVQETNGVFARYRRMLKKKKTKSGQNIWVQFFNFSRKKKRKKPIATRGHMKNTSFATGLCSGVVPVDSLKKGTANEQNAYNIVEWYSP